MVELQEESVSPQGVPLSYPLVNKIYYLFLLVTFGVVFGVGMGMTIWAMDASDVNGRSWMDGYPGFLVLLAIICGPGCLSLMFVGPLILGRITIFYARMLSTRGAPSSMAMQSRMVAEVGLVIALPMFFGVSPYFSIYASAMGALSLMLVIEFHRRIFRFSSASLRESIHKRREVSDGSSAGKAAVHAGTAMDIVIMGMFILPCYIGTVGMVVMFALWPCIEWLSEYSETMAVLAAGLYVFSFVDAYFRYTRAKLLDYEPSPLAKTTKDFKPADWFIVNGAVGFGALPFFSGLRDSQLGYAMNVAYVLAMFIMVLPVLAQGDYIMNEDAGEKRDKEMGDDGLEPPTPSV